MRQVSQFVTEDFDVLARSDIWISFEQTVKNDLMELKLVQRRIYYVEIKKQYNINMFQKNQWPGLLKD